MTHTCPHCRNQFQAKRLDQVYCRQSCRQRAYIKRNRLESSKHQNVTTANPLQGIDVAGLLGNISPETVAPLLSILAQNPSLMEKLTGNTAQTSEKSKEETKKPSQNVSDGSRENLNKHGKFMEDSWKANNENVNTVKSYTRPFDENNILAWMVEQKLTLRIDKNGYVRSLFPHWSNKEWDLSLHVNERMLKVFKYLQKASYNKVIGAESLCDCHKLINDFSSGIYAYALPQDYPFHRFLNLLAGRLEKLVERLKGQTKVKFSIPDDLHKMMTLLEIQLGSEN